MHLLAMGVSSLEKKRVYAGPLPIFERTCLDCVIVVAVVDLWEFLQYILNVNPLSNIIPK